MGRKTGVALGLAVAATAPASAQQAAPAAADATVQLDAAEPDAPGHPGGRRPADRRQSAQTVDEATRYSPGIHSQTFGDDPRNDWFLIRGFAEQTTGYYLDGLQLFSTSFATFKLEPWNLERVEVVRGPESVLYGGGDPGGLIDAVSKLPTFANFGVVEAGVNQYGNAYGAFDVGGVTGDKGQWSYRMTSIGRAGGTQVNHTDEDRAFVAPSLSYRPDGGSIFTILGQCQHDFTNGQNFLPCQGTVTPAPYGRIPTNLFTSEPSLDTFGRDQSMIGYRLAADWIGRVTAAPFELPAGLVASLVRVPVLIVLLARRAPAA